MKSRAMLLLFVVISAKPRIQAFSIRCLPWIPTFAGITFGSALASRTRRLRAEGDLCTWAFRGDNRDGAVAGELGLVAGACPANCCMTECQRRRAGGGCNGNDAVADVQEAAERAADLGGRADATRPGGGISRWRRYLRGPFREARCDR